MASLHWDRIDLLKIDIEGSEASFVEKEANFLRSVGMLVVEMHHWLVDAHCLERTLEGLGFRRAKVLATDNDADVRLYLNRARAGSPLDNNPVVCALLSWD